MVAATGARVLGATCTPTDAPASVARHRLACYRRSHRHPRVHAVRQTIKHILAEYGAVALVVYFAIFFAVLFGFWAAIRFGWRTESTAASVGTLTAAYIATKLTQPLRIAATLALTPLAAKLYERMGGRRTARASAEAPTGENEAR